MPKSRSKTSKRPSRASTGTSSRKWSRHVMETSDALDLDAGVFKRPPREIAKSLQRSAERSTRRKSGPFRSAMSMLTFYENRGGKNLSASARHRLERAKDELRALYGKQAGSRATSRRATAKASRGRRR